MTAGVPAPGRRWRRRLAVAALLAFKLWLLAVGLLWWRQESLLFRPTPLPAEHRFELGADVHEVWLDVPGARLNALHLRLPAPDGVVFFLHGNAGNLEGWFVNVDYYRRLNLDLFMLDYRGFGKSSSRIESQAQLLADVRAAWDHVAPQYAGLRRVVYGRSLGSGLAAALATEVQPDQTVLVSPYFSMQALAGEKYPWVPGLALRYPLRTDEALPRIRGPVLLAHGGRDTLIPADHSRRLQALRPATELLLVPEAGHGDIQRYDVYLEGLRERLRSGLASQSSASK